MSIELPRVTWSRAIARASCAGALILLALVSGGATAQEAVWYGPGENDDIDGGYYFAHYDPASTRGGGVTATWEGAAGYVAALPMYYDGADPVTREMVYRTPIPAFPLQTRILVNNPRSGQQVIVSLAGYGPALWTGAAIALSLDAKRALGLPDGADGYVYYQVLLN